MKENDKTMLPVPVDENKDFEVYEYNGNLCMTTEFLGTCLGYAHPGQSMRKLFERNKAILDPHRFSVTVTLNPQGGRPTHFYDEVGILKVIVLANTVGVKEFGLRLIDRLQLVREQQRAKKDAMYHQLQDKYMCLLEKEKGPKRTNLSTEEKEKILNLALQGHTTTPIMEQMNRSKSAILDVLNKARKKGLLT